MKGLPLAYNRDLQEDKEPLFDAFDTVEACLELAAVVVDGATLRADRIAARLDDGFLDATTLMEHLIRQGVPQRTGHEIVGKLVGLCERQGCRRLADLPDAEFAKAHPSLAAGVKGSWASPTPSGRSALMAPPRPTRWRGNWPSGRRRLEEEHARRVHRTKHMDHFHYRDGQLYCANRVPIAERMGAAWRCPGG